MDNTHPDNTAMRRPDIVLAAMAVLIFFYFFLTPKMDFITCVVIVGIWVSSMVLDLWFTIANGSYIQKYEKSFVLSFAYERYSPKTATVITIIAESSCVVFLPFIVFLGPNYTASVAVAYFFAVLHITASYGNERFIKQKMKDLS